MTAKDETSLSTSSPRRRFGDKAAAAIQELIQSQVSLGAMRLHCEGTIAAGGMGVVELVTDQSLQRQAARKVLHARCARDQTMVEMFIREARITSRLDHPNIVPVHELGLDDSGNLFFTMKLVQGSTLAETVAAIPDGPMSSDSLYDLLDVVVKVCDALSLAHSRGVIHCDVKPDNVMIGAYGVVYLMDWGVAQVLTGQGADALITEAEPLQADAGRDSETTFIGTLLYMSPEQAQGDTAALSERTDVFGVGALIYEMITKQAPYAKHSFMKTLGYAREGMFAAPEDVVAKERVPAGLRRIIMRAMARDPEDRYPSIAALRHEVVDFMRGRGNFPRESFAPGAFIVREGEPGSAAYIIESGHCEVFYGTDEQRQFIRAMGPGEIFGETAILSPGLRRARSWLWSSPLRCWRGK